MYFHETIRVPSERIGVIVGKNGRVRKRVEKLTNTKIEVSSREGAVTITTPPDEENENPILAWKARDIIRAMARGFSPKKALTLIEEDYRLIIISMRDLVGPSQSQIKRVAGRVIGENGRTRKFIEQTTDVLVSIYGKTVSLIGVNPGLDYARRAVTMLIDGAPHSSVYKYLERARREINRYEAELWEQPL